MLVLIVVGAVVDRKYLLCGGHRGQDSDSGLWECGELLELPEAAAVVMTSFLSQLAGNEVNN